jgi:hypothetical protein
VRLSRIRLIPWVCDGEPLSRGCCVPFLAAMSQEAWRISERSCLHAASGSAGRAGTRARSGWPVRPASVSRRARTDAAIFSAA